MKSEQTNNRAGVGLGPYVLAGAIVLVWCWVYGRTTLQAWNTPILYGGDAILVMANARAYMVGDLWPFLQKVVPHLNAPFVANWNDWPITEDILYMTMGWLGRVVGLFAAANLMVLIAQLLAGLSMWFVGSEIGGKREYVFLCSIAYAFSHYAFARGLPHFVLTEYWHLPLLCLISWWVFGPSALRSDNKKWILSLLLSLAAGVLNPYYSWMYVQFLGAAFLRHMIRRENSRAVESAILMAAVLCGFLLMNIDTLSYGVMHGVNHGAVARELSGIEVYGMKLPELFFPPFHRWGWFQNFSQKHYYSVALIKGEFGFSYIGVLGVFGLLALFFGGMFFLLDSKEDRVPVEWWQTAWVVFYSLIGGLNLIVGSLGIVLFRAANRYSIVILTLSLLYLIRILSDKFPSRKYRLVAILFIPLVLWDQLPSRVSADVISADAARVNADRTFALELEKMLPVGSMVFQLPVAPYPEVPPIVSMTDYEQFRPYLFTTSLRYSYGTDKGRGVEEWQADVAAQPSAVMVKTLESYGFGSVYINKNGFQDRGEGLKVALLGLGKPVIAESNDLIAFGLTPLPRPMTPVSSVWNKGWSGPEEGHRWAIDSMAEITIDNPGRAPRPVHVAFALRGLQAQKFRIYFDGALVKEVSYLGGHEVDVRIAAAIPSERRGVLRIVSDVVPALPGNGDQRKLAFDLVGYSVN